MATGELEYVSDEEGIATEGSDSLTDDIVTLPHDMTSEWYGNCYPPGLILPSPYCDSTYRTRFYGFQPFGASIGHGPQRSQPGPSQPPVEVDVSEVRLCSVH